MALPALAQREALFLAELDRRGYNPAQKAAIMGSVRQESGFNPWAKEQGGTGVGLFQWSYGRAAKVPKATGDYATDVAKQLDLFEAELAGSERKAGAMLKGAQDLGGAAAAMKAFERYGVAGNRYPFMAQYAERLGAGTLKPSQDTTTAGAATAAPLTPGGQVESPAAASSSPEAAVAAGGIEASLLDAAKLSGLSTPAGARLAAALSADLGGPAAKGQAGGASDGLDLVTTLAGGEQGQAVAQGGRMAGGALGVVGRVARPEEDVFPTTGAHLDVRVIKPDGSYVNPEFARSILKDLHVGGKPLYSQQGDQWVAAAPITSRFGPRSAPTAGASSNHLGVDFGVGANTELAWMGAGELSHQNGYRSIKTPQGYEIRLLHTKPVG